MLKRIMTLVVLLSCSVTAWADYLADRNAAMELVKAGKQEEALAAFTKMAEATANEAQKTDALDQAAMCAHRLKKYDQAMELAQKIPQAPMSKAVQMRLMIENRKGADLILKFKDEDIASWPEKAAGEAYYCLGLSYFQAKDGKAAEANLRKALDTLGEGYTRDVARLNLADNYRQNLKDDKQALETYLEGIEKSVTRGWVPWTCIISAADILRGQGKADEALQVLGKVNADTMTGYWGAAMRQAYAEVYATQGKKAEAIAKMKEAAEVKGIADWQKAGLEKRLKELQGETK